MRSSHVIILHENLGVDSAFSITLVVFCALTSVPEKE